MRPGLVIGKGGITLSDAGTQGLRATRPGIGTDSARVPVAAGKESLFPGLAYVVFPGMPYTRDATDIVSGSPERRGRVSRRALVTDFHRNGGVEENVCAIIGSGFGGHSPSEICLDWVSTVAHTAPAA